MNRRFISVLLALSLSSTIAACGSDDENTRSTPLALSGVYRPVDQGSIGSITFSGNKDYLLMPKGCGGGGCAEIGTYRLDTDSKLLVLENGTTHQTRSIALEVMETSQTSASLVQSIAPLDLVDPGDQLTRPGQQTTNGSQKVTGNGQQQLATGGNGITGAVSQLLQLIQQAMMNGQQMQRDDQADAKPADPMQMPMQMPMNDPKVDCKQGIPTKDTPLAEVAAYFARCPGGP